MTSGLTWLLVLGCLTRASLALPTGSSQDDAKRNDQIIRPKVKRAQEMLMFGNQQNRPAESSSGSNSFAPTSEKRDVSFNRATGTLGSSGLDGLKVALSETEKTAHAVKQPSMNELYADPFAPYEKNYEYGKVLVNELGDEMPRMWDVPAYPRYYATDDRRKRSERMPSSTPTSVSSSSTTTPPFVTSTQQPSQQQLKRRIPFYPEPRYKRELELDPQVATLLALWEKERMNRNNWRGYGNDEYDNGEDEGELLEEEPMRNGIPWLDGTVYAAHHYAPEPLSASDIGIPRTHPAGYYDQYESLPYGALYPPQQQYYPQEKRYVVAKKRVPTYDPYESLAQLQMNSQPRGYYQHRLVY